MRLGLMTDSLGGLTFDEMLDACEKLGLQTLEIPCGAWSAAPHIDVDALLASREKRAEYMKKIEAHGLEIAALNCSGNPLDPGERGREHDLVVHKTFRLAGLMGIRRIVMMSGLPGGLPGDKSANWILTSWPPENLDMLKYQWEVCAQYWTDLVSEARSGGIEKIALEPHGCQLVYNVENLRTLRAMVGGCDDLIGYNIDPSHPFWMGADPIQVVRELRESIFYCHVKDVHVNRDKAAINTMLDCKDNDRMYDRSWNFVTPGAGHDELWWTTFARELRLAGYDDVMSFEMEDHSDGPLETLTRAVRFIRRVI